MDAPVPPLSAASRQVSDAEFTVEAEVQGVSGLTDLVVRDFFKTPAVCALCRGGVVTCLLACGHAVCRPCGASTDCTNCPVCRAPVSFTFAVISAEEAGQPGSIVTAIKELGPFWVVVGPTFLHADDHAWLSSRLEPEDVYVAVTDLWAGMDLHPDLVALLAARQARGLVVVGDMDAQELVAVRLRLGPHLPVVQLLHHGQG